MRYQAGTCVEIAKKKNTKNRFSSEFGTSIIYTRVNFSSIHVFAVFPTFQEKRKIISTCFGSRTEGTKK